MAEKKELTKPNAKTIEDLSDELLTKILKALPSYKHVQNCKVINKRFKRLISNPSFIRRLGFGPQKPRRRFEVHTVWFPMLFHLNKDTSNKKLLCLDSKERALIWDKHSFPFSFLPCFRSMQYDRIMVEASHNDLLLCRFSNPSQLEYYICNPITKHCVALPPTRHYYPNEEERVGFIYDASHSRFRVVRITFLARGKTKTFQVHVFSSEIGKWSYSRATIPKAVTLSSISHPKSAFAYNGTLIWWVKELGFLVCDPFNNGTCDSKWRIITKPHNISEFDDIHCIGICNGKLRMCIRQGTMFTFWRLENFVKGIFSMENKFSVSSKTVMVPALHPLHEDLIHLYLNGRIYMFNISHQCSHDNRLRPVCYVANEGEPDFENVMSLVLQAWPTPIPVIGDAAYN